MSSETVEVPTPRAGATGHRGPRQNVAYPESISTRPDMPRPDMMRQDMNGRQAIEAKLAAGLAQHGHVTLDLEHPILPLHDEPFDLPALRAVVRFLPASHDSRVGGDWYITADMPSGKVLIAVGDGAGHGLAAAAGMARMRGALAGLAITGAPPQQLVGWLNDLARHVDPEHTASVLAGYFDPATQVLSWAQAGHPPPILVRGADAWALPQPEGILLGAGDRGYHVASQQLTVGDVLRLYSDGLVERRDQSIDDGLSTLVRAAAGCGGPDEVVSTVLAALGSTATDDDTCLVAIQVL